MISNEILWPLLAILAAITICTNLLVSQFYKTPGHYLVFWSRIMVFAASLPVMFVLEWPTDPRFYIAVALTGIIAGLADTKVMNITAVYRGGTVSRVMPFQIVVIFVMWLMIKPSEILEYLARPFFTALVLTALAGCIYFSTRIRNCPISGNALRGLIWPMVGYSLNFVFAKYAFEHAPLHSGVYYYIIIQTAVIIPVMVLLSASKTSGFRLDPVILKSRAILFPSFLIFLGWMAHMITKNYANALAPNPSYVAALVMTSPVWMILIYKAAAIKDDGDLKSGMGLMVCAIFLTVLGF